MSDLLSGGLLLPAMVLAAFGWVVPRLLSLLFPEGVKALLLLGFVSTLVMFALGVGFFILLYIGSGVPLTELFEPGLASGLYHFGRLGLISALLWGPIMVLSLSGLPRTWVKETW